MKEVMTSFPYCCLPST